MAGYRGHILGAGLSIAVLVTVVLLLPLSIFVETAPFLENWQVLIGLLIVGILFGLFPDVDTNSRGQDIFFGIAFVTDILLIWSGRLEAAAYLGLISMTPIVGSHRGWTHKKISAFLVPLPVLLVPYIYNSENLIVGSLFYSAAVVGYLSHLLLDGLIIKSFRIKSKSW